MTLSRCVSPSGKLGVTATRRSGEQATHGRDDAMDLDFVGDEVMCKLQSAKAQPRAVGLAGRGGFSFAAPHHRQPAGEQRRLPTKIG